MSNAAGQVHFFKERIFPVLFMFLVTVVFIAIVSGIYLATRDDVLRNEQLFLKRAVLFAADQEIPEGAVLQEQLYNEIIREVRDEEGNLRYFVISSNGGTAGYVIQTSGPGVWGEIEAVVGFDAQLDKLTGIDFIKQNETPGLGGRITEEWFREQFRGKTGPFSRVPEGTESTTVTEFDAITGATLTSKAVQQILNDTIETAPEILGRE